LIEDQKEATSKIKEKYGNVKIDLRTWEILDSEIIEEE